jgi:hypothetical protein
MGIDSIWTSEGNYLTDRKHRFKARSTGCDCCSIDLLTKEEVKKEVIDSLATVLRAHYYFRFSWFSLIKEAKEKIKKENSEKHD